MIIVDSQISWLVGMCFKLTVTKVSSVPKAAPVTVTKVPPDEPTDGEIDLNSGLNEI